MASYQYRLTKGLFINMTLATEFILMSKHSVMVSYNNKATTSESIEGNSGGELVFPFSTGLAKQVYKGKKMIILLEPYYSNELFFYRYLGLKDPYNFPSVGMRTHLKF